MIGAARKSHTESVTLSKATSFAGHACSGTGGAKPVVVLSVLSQVFIHILSSKLTVEQLRHKVKRNQDDPFQEAVHI